MTYTKTRITKVTKKNNNLYAFARRIQAKFGSVIVAPCICEDENGKCHPHRTRFEEIFNDGEGYDRLKEVCLFYYKTGVKVLFAKHIDNIDFV